MSRSIYKGKNYEFVYNLDNYMINKDDSSNRGVCVIYCSSSGLYYPNTEEEFIEAFIKTKDKYEWKNNQITNANKSIWIRDITKEFYIRGINKRLNSIDKLLSFLQDEVQGYDVITVGSSAGGYIATLIGCYLNAKRVYCFSGFFDLNVIDKETWPLVYEYCAIPEYQKWYNLKDIIENSETKVFYFYPGKLAGDIMQSEVVKGADGVFSFQFESKVHGIPFKDSLHIPLLNKILNMPEDELLKLYMFFQGEKIKKIEWIFHVLLSRWN